MWVTAYTDGSLRNGRTAWAIWLRSERGRLVESGLCPDDIADSNQAELYAARMAIVMAVGTWSDTRGVLINTDSKYVINVLNRNTKPRGPAVELLKDILAMGLRIRVKHCPGHNGDASVAAYLNRQVDELAGQHTE